MREKVPIKTTETIFEIITTLVEQDGATASELTKELNMPTSTIHDHLQTLDHLGLVVEEDHIYRISTRFLELGSRRRKKMDIYQETKPELHRLANETGEHASLMIEEKGIGVLLYTARGDNAVQVPTYGGARAKLHMTAPGKAIMAHLPDERIGEIIDTHGLPERTKNTITSRDELTEELQQIREQGYSVDNQEIFEGMRAIGAPLLDQNNQILGAISVYGPVNRLDDDRFKDDIPQNVLQAANVIEVNLNYS